MLPPVRQSDKGMNNSSSCLVSDINQDHAKCRHFESDKIIYSNHLSEVCQIYLAKKDELALLAVLNKDTDFQSYIEHSGICPIEAKEILSKAQFLDHERDNMFAWSTIHGYVASIIGVEKPSANLDEAIMKVSQFIDKLTSPRLRNSGFFSLTNIVLIHDFRRAIEVVDKIVDDKDAVIGIIFRQLDTVGKGASYLALQAVYKITNAQNREHNIDGILKRRQIICNKHIKNEDEVALLEVLNQNGMPYKENAHYRYFFPHVETWIKRIWIKHSKSDTESEQEQINTALNFIGRITTCLPLKDHGLRTLAYLVKSNVDAQAIISSISDPIIRNYIPMDLSNKPASQN